MYRRCEECGHWLGLMNWYTSKQVYNWRNYKNIIANLYIYFSDKVSHDHMYVRIIIMQTFI